MIVEVPKEALSEERAQCYGTTHENGLYKIDPNILVYMFRQDHLSVDVQSLINMETVDIDNERAFFDDWLQENNINILEQ